MSAAARRLGAQMHFRCTLGHPDPDVPGGNGGVNWAPMAYSPRTNYFYVTAADRPAARIAPGSGRVAPPAFGAKYAGTLTAVTPVPTRSHGKSACPIRSARAAARSPPSDVVFHGEPDGHVQAYDARNGELLWQWQTGAGADAPAITDEIDGVQYFTIAVGGLATQTASSNGDMVWASRCKATRSSRRPVRGSPTAADRSNLRVHRAAQGRNSGSEDECGADDRLQLHAAAHHGRGRQHGHLYQ